MPHFKVWGNACGCACLRNGEYAQPARNSPSSRTTQSSRGHWLSFFGVANLNEGHSRAPACHRNGRMQMAQSPVRDDTSRNRLRKWTPQSDDRQRLVLGKRLSSRYMPKRKVRWRFTSSSFGPFTASRHPGVTHACVRFPGARTIPLNLSMQK